MPPYWLMIVLLALATHRLTRLVTRDAFPPVRAVREWIDRKLGDEHWLAYLTQCDWCASVWIGGVLTLGAWWFQFSVSHDQPLGWPWWVMSWLTASTVTGLIAQREPD